jgi:hypothetical protein
LPVLNLPEFEQYFVIVGYSVKNNEEQAFNVDNVTGFVIVLI